jgi:hypothetical protein
MLLHATVIASILLGLPITWRALRATEIPDQTRFRVRPERWLAVVAALLFLNQVLFTVYALRVRHGDMSYLGDHIPDGWFVLADGPAMGRLVDHMPFPQLLAVCALRIPSLLELPFGMLAYLTVLHWLNPGLYRRLTSTPVIALMAGSYSITFGLIEWELHTPYTNQNLILRAISCVVTVLLLRRATSGPGHAPRNAAELLAFAASTAALGYLILAFYDSVLLYSLGKAGAHLPGALVASGVIAASRFAAARMRRRPSVAPAGPGVDTLATGLSWWLALFLIPALAIRYELGFGSRPLAAAAGLLVIGVATAATLNEVHGRLATGATGRWLLGLLVAAIAAVAAAGVALAVPTAHVETQLLWAGALFVLTATLVCVAWDRGFAAEPQGSTTQRRQRAS